MRGLGWLALLAVAATALGVQEAQAQAPPQDYRGVQLRKLDTERDLLLAMADSMPESLYSDRVTPEQRDFAHQLHHAASVVAFVCVRLFGADGSAVPDTIGIFDSRQGLRGYVNGVYDMASRALQNQSDEDRQATANLFGQAMPTWQVWDEIHMHTMWTAGQVVANFRKHGMPPPAFRFF